MIENVPNWHVLIDRVTEALEGFPSGSATGERHRLFTFRLPLSNDLFPKKVTGHEGGHSLEVGGSILK